MTHSALYSLRTDGDQWRITKFVDGDVESSYLTTHSECDCPAGHRHTCRHRQMLPQMLAHKLADSMWFFDYDRGGQIVDFNGTSKHLLDQLTSIPKEITATEIDERMRNIQGPGNALLEPLVDHMLELATKAVEAKPWRRL